MDRNSDQEGSDQKETGIGQQFREITMAFLTVQKRMLHEAKYPKARTHDAARHTDSHTPECFPQACVFHWIPCQGNKLAVLEYS